MKVLIERKPLEKILGLVRPITTNNDIRQITNSVLLEFSIDTLRVCAYGEEIFIDTLLPITNQEFIGKILLDAKTLYNVATFNDSQFLEISTDSSQKELEEGNGLIVIKGNSKYSIPVRNSETFPDRMDYSGITFSALDILAFLDSLNRMSKFTDKTSVGYERGVFFSGKRVIATNHRHIFLEKEIFPFENVSFAPELSRVLEGTINVLVGRNTTPKSIIFKAELEGISCSLTIGVFPIDDECPTDRIFPIIHSWVTSDKATYKLSKEELARAISRIKGISYDLFSFVDVSIGDSELIFSYVYNQYEVVSRIPCEIEGKTNSFRIYIRDIENLLSVCVDDFKVSVSNEKPVLLYEEENKLLCISLLSK